MFVKGEESHEANDVGQITFDLGAEIGPPVFMFQRQLEERNHNSTFSAIGGWTVGQDQIRLWQRSKDERPQQRRTSLPPFPLNGQSRRRRRMHVSFILSLSTEYLGRQIRNGGAIAA